MTVKDIIKSIGGVSYVCQTLKLKYKSVVYGWIERDKIPDWRIDAIIKIADEKGIKLPNDFYPQNKQN